MQVVELIILVRFTLTKEIPTLYILVTNPQEMKVLKSTAGIYLSLQRPTTAQDKQCLQLIPLNPCTLIRASGLD